MSSSGVVVLLGSVVSGKHTFRFSGAVLLLRSLWWRAASERDDEDGGCLGFKVSKEGGELE